MTAGGIGGAIQVEHLQTPAQFRLLLAGPRVASSEHFALHRRDVVDLDPTHCGGASHWVGAVIPKRWARRAVTRNLIRRQIYSLMHELRESVPPSAYLVRLRTAFDRRVFVSASSPTLRRALRAELQQLLGAVVCRSASPPLAS